MLNHWWNGSEDFERAVAVYIQALGHALIPCHTCQ